MAQIIGTLSMIPTGIPSQYDFISRELDCQKESPGIFLITSKDRLPIGDMFDTGLVTAAFTNGASEIRDVLVCGNRNSIRIIFRDKDGIYTSPTQVCTFTLFASY